MLENTKAKFSRKLKFAWFLSTVSRVKPKHEKN